MGLCEQGKKSQIYRVLYGAYKKSQICLLDPNKNLHTPSEQGFEPNLDGVGWSGRGIVFTQYYATLIQYVVVAYKITNSQ